MYWLFRILVYLDTYLPKSGWTGEGLGFLTGQDTLLSLRTGRVGGERVGLWERNGRRGGSGKFEWYYL